MKHAEKGKMENKGSGLLEFDVGASRQCGGSGAATIVACGALAVWASNDSQI